MNFNEKMDHDLLEQELNALNKKYKQLELFSIGKSWEGRNIYALKMGNGKKTSLYVGAHHALEWCTTQILIKFIDDIFDARDKNKAFKGVIAHHFFDKACLIVIPMLNPDGVNLSINGMSPSHPLYERTVKSNGGSDDFSAWQANIRGIDLNHNYDAGFDLCKKAEQDMGIFLPCATRYGGEYPESEKESFALVSFTMGLKPDLTVAFHSQGEEIYSGYLNKDTGSSLGEIFAKMTGYKLCKPEGIASYAGYKDWICDKLGLNAFTVECGSGVNPLNPMQTKLAYMKLMTFLISAPMLA